MMSEVGGWAEVPEQDRDDLLGVHSSEDLEFYAELGYYAGYRVGIEAVGSADTTPRLRASPKNVLIADALRATDRAA